MFLNFRYVTGYSLGPRIPSYIVVNEFGQGRDAFIGNVCEQPGLHNTVNWLNDTYLFSGPVGLPSSRHDRLVIGLPQENAIWINDVDIGHVTRQAVELLQDGGHETEFYVHSRDPIKSRTGIHCRRVSHPERVYNPSHWQALSDLEPRRCLDTY